MRRTLLSLQRVAIACSLAFVFVSQSANADLVVFNVNSLQSNLTLGGNAFGLNYTEQSSGSLINSWSGTIIADVTGGLITFSGGSVITANVNPNGPFTASPNPNEIVGAQNYGVRGIGVVPGFGNSTINGVYRDLVLDITTGTAQNGIALAATMQFDAGVLVFGAATELAGNPFGTSSVDGSGENTSSSLVSFDGTTLIIPVAFRTTGGNREEFWTGTITATAVPEPTSLGLVALVGIGFAAAARRRMGVTNQAC